MRNRPKRYRFGSWLLALAAAFLLVPLGYLTEHAAINFAAFFAFAAGSLILRTERFGAVGLLIGGLGVSFGIWGHFQFTGIPAHAYMGVIGASVLAFIAIFGPLWRRRPDYA